MKYSTIIFIFCFCVLTSQIIYSQNSPGLYFDTKGRWTFTFFGTNIIKTTFHPQNYLYDDQISNAVIKKATTVKINNPNVGAYYTINKEGINYKHGGNNLILLNYFDSGKYKGFRFQLSKGERIYGTGERSVPLDRRGFKLNLNNNPWYGYGVGADNLNYSVPFIISSEGYGIFFDNPSRGYLDIGKTDPDVLEYGASSGELTFYIINGKNVDEILRNYQTLVGTQPIPARWVFGNLMSRFGYRSEEQLMSIVNKMHEQNIPVDAVILDLFWFGDSIKHTLGNLDWINKKAWPNPTKMISNLKQQGIKTILITEPFVVNTSLNYDASKKYQAVDSTGKIFLLTTFYFGNGGLLDIFRKDAQDWFWNKYKPQIAKGVGGWWGDLGEPETHPSAMYHNLKDLGFKRLFKADEVHNIYGHYWDKMLFDKYAKEYPNVRLFNLNRSGYAGSPRYGVFPWSGDVSRSWSGLQAQLPLMIGMSMSGVPYVHADAGGFAGGDGDAELYTRWLQFATFTPVFRPHGTALGDLGTDRKDIPSEAALYDDPYKSIVRKYIRLRYSLLPYNYTLAYEQSKFGKPLVHSLFYYNDADSNLLKAENEFMWGDEILVAPVLEKGATERKLYLPEGEWYNLITSEKKEGGQWINEKVDLNDIPVFVKAGSIVPTFTEPLKLNSTNDYTGKQLTVKYYPSSIKANFTMYDDDGVTNNNWLTGNYELINFEAIEKGNTITFQISTKGKIQKAKREIIIIMPKEIQVISVNGRSRITSSNRVDLQYTGSPIKLVLHFDRPPFYMKRF